MTILPQINEQILDQALQKAKVAARAAGQAIRNLQGSDLQISTKSGYANPSGQILTLADLASQACILEHLQPLADANGWAILSEEAPDDGLRHQREAFFCIDPLDGTLPFSEGREGFSVSIALVHQSGVPLLGVVYDPTRDILYSAISGQVAYREDASGCMVFCVQSSAENDFVNLFLDRSVALDGRYDHLRPTVFAGGVLNALWAIENAPGAFFRPIDALGGGSLWDYAASACIASAAGGVVSDLQGQPLHLNPQGTTRACRHGIVYATSPEVAFWARGVAAQ